MREIGGEGQKWEGDAEKRERERKGEKRVGKGRRGKSPEGGGGVELKEERKKWSGRREKRKTVSCFHPCHITDQMATPRNNSKRQAPFFSVNKRKKKEAIPILVPNYINSSKTYFILDPSSTATPVLIKTSSVNKWHSRTLHSRPQSV